MSFVDPDPGSRKEGSEVKNVLFSKFFEKYFDTVPGNEQLPVINI
jgi:hypothetical protein